VTSEKVKTMGLVSIFAIIILGVLLLTFTSSTTTEEHPIQPAYKFKARDIDGKDVSLADYEGKIVILDFMYLAEQTCSHCRILNEEQIKELKKISDKYSDDQVQIISIDMTYDSSNNQVRHERDQNQITWPVINDVFVGSHTDRHFDQTSIGGKYIKFLLDEHGALINPTIMLLNKELEIVGVYHVGIITPNFDFDASTLSSEDLKHIFNADEMSERIDKLQRDEWGSTIEGRIFTGVSLTSMFLLGIFVAITPCALALLISMTAYVAGINVKKKKSQSEPDTESESDRKQEPGIVLMTEKNLKSPKKADAESDAWFGASVGLAFTLGIGVIFFLIGCLVTYIGFFISYGEVFYIIAGIILILFGIHNMIGIGVIIEKIKNRKYLESTQKMPTEIKTSLFERGRLFALKIVDKYVLFGAFFLGMLLALGWAPCAMAFVFPALILVLTQDLPVLIGGLYLFVFSLGYGIPIIFMATLTTAVKGKLANRFMKVGKWIPKVFGIVIIVIGILMISRWFGFIIW
jgi:cytochrome c biogenesis protein CcdA